MTFSLYDKREVESNQILDSWSNGFHASFQRHWDLIYQDIVNMVRHFLNSEQMLTCLNKIVIVLIPMTDRPQGLMNFRPISLCNVAFKIISKVFCNRLKILLATHSAPNQSAFPKGKLISTTIMLVDYYRKSILQAKIEGNWQH